MNVVDKYLFESTIKSDKGAIKAMLTVPPKSGKYTVDGETVIFTYDKSGTSKKLTIEYPSALSTFTYNLVVVCDSLQYKVKFIPNRSAGITEIAQITLS